MERKLQRYFNRIAGLTAPAILAFAAAAIHDMQTSEGVGLYYALMLGGERLPFDLAADLAALLGLLLLTLLPCVLLGHRSASGFCRMLIGFLAFMPALSMAYLINPLREEADFSPAFLLSVLQTEVSFICLLAAALSLEEGGRDGLNTRMPQPVWKRWYSLCCLTAVLLAAGTFCLPVLQPLFNLALAYLLLLVCFDLWERLCGRRPAMNTWGWLLFGGLAFRAAYVLVEIMKKY